MPGLPSTLCSCYLSRHRRVAAVAFDGMCFIPGIDVRVPLAQTVDEAPRAISDNSNTKTLSICKMTQLQCFHCQCLTNRTCTYHYKMHPCVVVFSNSIEVEWMFIKGKTSHCLRHVKSTDLDSEFSFSACGGEMRCNPFMQI